MTPRHRSGRRAALLLGGLIAASPLAAQSHVLAQASAAPTSETYARRDDCIAAGRLDAAQCDQAYRNARAEFEQAVPRYGIRAACERAHKVCAAQVAAAGGWEQLARSRAVYLPRFRGISVIGEGEQARALPLVEGGGRLRFKARSAVRPEETIAGRALVVGEAHSRGRRRDPSAPFHRRGDRDDTIRVPMERRNIGAAAAPGLYVDEDGVEWYKPGRR